MKGFALVAIAVLLLPAMGASASDAQKIDYPPDLVAMLPGWIQKAENLSTPADHERPWWNETGSFLDKAKAAAGAGRFRVTLFHLETYQELLMANRLLDDGRSLHNDAQAKQLILQRTSGIHDDATHAWASYRARLHGYDGQLHSLVTIEKTLYSADVALNGMLNTASWDDLAKAFPGQDGIPEGYVFGLVRASTTALGDVQWADEMLSVALKGEGIPPRARDANWTALSSVAVRVPTDQAPPYLEALDKISLPARQNNESTLAVAVTLAEARARRANEMQTIFGDAKSRGLDVVGKAAHGMNSEYNNTTVSAPQSVGLTGVFTSDALDRVDLTNEYLKAQKADLGTVIGAWAELEHAAYAANALATLSSVTPPPTPVSKAAPGVAAGALVALVLVVAVARRRS